ncbi:hypothetical protein GGR55DRAFT_640012 [Xylaria sp. FL0064]|nr:hypothetical protein GGR55DRAFT_640012 [Xylaria sp. FL0064]
MPGSIKLGRTRIVTGHAALAHMFLFLQFSGSESLIYYRSSIAFALLTLQSPTSMLHLESEGVSLRPKRAHMASFTLVPARNARWLINVQWHY